MPGFKSGISTRLHRGCARDSEQWSSIQPVRRGHARKTRSTRAPGETEQHGLGLVIERVCKKDSARARLIGDAIEGRVPSLSSGRLRATLTLNRDAPNENRVKTELASLPSCPFSDVSRTLLQAVVDDNRSRAESSTRCLKSDGRSKCEGICAAAQTHKHECFGLKLLKMRTNGTPNVSNC